MLANGGMLLEDPGKLHRQLPPAEVNHLPAKLMLDAVQGSFLQVRRVVAHSRLREGTEPSTRCAAGATRSVRLARSPLRASASPRENPTFSARIIHSGSAGVTN